MGVTLSPRRRPARVHCMRQALFLVILCAAFTGTTPTSTSTGSSTTTTPPSTKTSLATTTPPTTKTSSTTTTPPTATTTASTTMTPSSTITKPPTIMTSSTTKSLKTTTTPATTTSVATTTPPRTTTTFTTMTPPIATANSSTTTTHPTIISTPNTKTVSLATMSPPKSTTSSIISNSSTTTTPPKTTSPARTSTAAPPSSKKEKYERLILALFKIKGSLLKILATIRETKNFCIPGAQVSDPCHELGLILGQTEQIISKVIENADDVSDSLLLQLEEHQRSLEKPANQNETAFHNLNLNETVSRIEIILKVSQESSDQAQVFLDEIIQTAETSSSFVIGLSVSLGVTALIIFALFMYFGYKNELARRQMKMVKAKVDPSEEANINNPNVCTSTEATQSTLQSDRVPHRAEGVVASGRAIPTPDNKNMFPSARNESWSHGQSRPSLADGIWLQSLGRPADPMQYLTQDKSLVHRPWQRVASYTVPDNHAPRYPTERPQGPSVHPGVFQNLPVPQTPGYERANPQQLYQPLGRMENRGVIAVLQRGNGHEVFHKIPLHQNDSERPIELPRVNVNTTRNLPVTRPAHYHYFSS